MPNLDFTLTGDYVELHNLLKITGLADSGGSAKLMVASGAVTVDGQVELRKNLQNPRGPGRFAWGHPNRRATRPSAAAVACAAAVRDSRCTAAA